MNKFVSQILSTLLLLCFTVTIAPLEYLHHHESVNHGDCNHSDLLSFTDSDVSIISESHEECELCELLSTHRFDLASNETKQTVSEILFNQFFSFQSTKISVEISDENSGRAPPQLI